MTDREVQIIELRRAGLGQRVIAKRLGISKTCVAYACKKHDLCGVRVEGYGSMRKCVCVGCGIEFLRKSHGGAKGVYHSRQCAYAHQAEWQYKTVPRCKDCKAEIPNGTLCPKCKERRSVLKGMQRTSHEAGEQIGLRTCVVCNTAFVGVSHKGQTCSRKCAERRQKDYCNQYREHVRKRRARTNGRHEAIRLCDLVSRDSGICYLCGHGVDMSADRASGEYGSIDHVHPLSRGGTHTWDNVKLAHRACNIKKRNKILSL